MTLKAVEELSKSVERAMAEIKRLRRENARLEEKAAKLEKGLEAAPDTEAAAAAWREEREAIRTRVEKLAEGLEEALAD